MSSNSPDSESLQGFSDTPLEERRGTPDRIQLAPHLEQAPGSVTSTMKASSGQSPPASTTNQAPSTTITSEMVSKEMVTRLKSRGCTDLTESFDQTAFSQYPVEKGGFGDVFKGKLIDGSPVAIKTIRMYAPGDELHLGTYLKRGAKEIYTWSKCNHPNVVQLVGFALFRDTLAMISRWEENGNLPRYLSRHPGANRYKLIESMCAGLLYLHESNIVHGDLKGANVLIAEDGRPMLMDFGNASLLTSTLQFTQTTSVPSFSVRWAAPEILGGTTGHTKAGDIYSLGMTILETLTGEFPFTNVKLDIAVLQQVVVDRKTPQRPEDIIPPTSHDGNILWDLMMSCWSFEPERRPSVEGVLEAMAELRIQLKQPIMDTPKGSSAQSLGPPPKTTITSTMACADIIALLKARGCPDITQSLDQDACSNHPVASGGFGDVYKGKLINGPLIAIKTFRVNTQQDTLQDGLRAGTIQKRAAKELHTWSQCNHPNVVRLLGLATFRDSLAMISRWEKNGNLLDYLSLHPDTNRCELCVEICAGLSYLHGGDIIHGDLRGLNVLIAEDGRAMLADFGSANLLETTLHFTQTASKPGFSPRWAAPEILQGRSKQTKASDVYSLGMTILETLTGEVPFAKKNDRAIYMEVVVKKKMPLRPMDIIPETSIYGNTLWVTLVSCWSFNPGRRPSAQRVWELMKPLEPGELRPIKDETDWDEEEDEDEL